MKRFSITTLGCRVNRFESDALSQSLQDRGLRPSGPGEETGAGEVCIINTCTVTQKASMQSRQAIRRAIRRNPQARIIVTGCYAQTEPDAIARIEGVDEVVGHSGKFTLASRIPCEPGETAACCGAGKNTLPLFAPAAAGGRTRPVLKVQDGCNAFCTYCIVPYARGRSRSIPPDTVLEHLDQLYAAGYREVVLSGIHLGVYGRDLKPHNSLFRLLARISARSPIERVRLSSIEPLELTDEIIALVADSDKFCHHFHIPLQSGDDGILKRMGRPYCTADFGKVVENIHRRLPDAGIGADVLVGFPGESETAFENTIHLITDLPLTYLHVFPFSPRPGTPAAKFSDPIPTPVIKPRAARLRQLGHGKQNRFYSRHVDRELTVLVEGPQGAPPGMVKGLTSNYIPICLPSEGLDANRFVRCRILAVDGENIVQGAVVAVVD